MEPADFYHDCLHRLNPEANSHWAAVAAAYQGRAYHNLQHLREMLGHYSEMPDATLPASLQQQREAALFGMALIYHDIVYVAGRKDNEARSADVLAEHLAELNATPKEINWCRELIMATKTHQLPPTDSGAAAVLIDLDLAVLARSPKGYKVYTKAIRKEFRRFPGFLYRPGRRKALRHFLAQENIYHTPYFQVRWEAQARVNLNQELSIL